MNSSETTQYSYIAHKQVDRRVDQMPERLIDSFSNQHLRRRLAVDEILFTQGEHGDVAYVIESGAIEIYCENHDHRSRIASLGPDELFGEMALLGDPVRTASAKAIQNTQLLVVTHEHLNECLQSAGPMMRYMLRTVVSRKREMLRRINGEKEGASHPPDLLPFQALMSEHEVDDREKAFGRIRIERELELALERNQFQLYFQPIIRLADHSVAGYEALIRWFKPGHGMVPPGEFIPVAEASTLINRIGLWVVETAFDSLLQMDEAAGGQRPLFLTLNLSARQLSDPALLPALSIQAEKLKGRRCCIKLEVTESLMISNVAEVQSFIGRCRELGVQIVLDDFGTGYCSLSYLHLFDVDTMKLDRSFVRGMAVSEASEKVVRGVTRIAHDLGLDVVAEGIESGDQAEQSKAMGIDFAQGFFFGRPAPLADALVKLKA